MNQTTTGRRQHHWDLRAAGNFIGGGTGSGLIVTAALAALSGSPFRLPLAIGFCCIAAGLSLVWLEIGKPWRAINVFFHPQTSWMTREGILAILLIPLGALAVATASLAAAVLTATLAAGFMFCQARILRAARGIPAWRQPEIVPLILSCGLAEGSGLYLIAGSHTALWLIFGICAGLLREAAWQAYRAGLARLPAGKHSLATFATPSARLAHAGQLAGLVLMLLALASLGPAGTALAYAGGALVAMTGWTVKALLITRAGFVRAAAVPVLPTRGSRGRHVRQSL